MNSVKKKLPIGIENFAKLQAEDFYYVDKTMLIKELLLDSFNTSHVTLYHKYTEKYAK